MNGAILHLVECVEYLQRALVVRHDNHSRTVLAGDSLEQFHHLLASVAVQSRGRLIRQNHAWAIGQGPSNGNALLLTTRKHRDAMIAAITDAEFCEQFQCPLSCNCAGDLR